MIGTVFFSAIGDDGAGARLDYVSGLERSLQVGMAISVVVISLTFLLPRTAWGPGDVIATQAPTRGPTD